MKKSILLFIAIGGSLLSSLADNISVADVTVTSGETANVCICLDNAETDLVSFQMDLTLPEGVTLNKADCSLSSRFNDGTQKLIIGRQPNGDYRLTSTSFSLTPITGNTGEIVTLSLSTSAESESGTATISNIRFVTSDSRKVTMANVTFNIQQKPAIATGIGLAKTSEFILHATPQGIRVENVSPGDFIYIYTLAGQLIKTIRMESSFVEITLPSNHVFLVKAGGKVFKLNNRK